MEGGPRGLKGGPRVALGGGQQSKLKRADRCTERSALGTMAFSKAHILVPFQKWSAWVGRTCAHPRRGIIPFSICACVR